MLQSLLTSICRNKYNKLSKLAQRASLLNLSCRQSLTFPFNNTFLLHIAKVHTFNHYSHNKKFVEKLVGSSYEAYFLDYVRCFISWWTLRKFSISRKKTKKYFIIFFPSELLHCMPNFQKKLPLMRFELMTPGLQDQCSATEL